MEMVAHHGRTMEVEVDIHTTCPFCGYRDRITVSAKDYLRWKEGAFIQDAFPELTPDKRELLKTGICDSCFPVEEAA